MKRALAAVLCLLLAALVGIGPAAATPEAEQAPATPVLSTVNTASCGSRGAVVSATQQVFVAATVQDPDNALVSITLTLVTADRQTQLGSLTSPQVVGTTVGYQLPSSAPLQSGHKYAVRAVASDGQRTSHSSPWCYFLVDNRTPSTPTQVTSSFGTTDPVGIVGQRGHVTVSGGGPATAQYQWTAEAVFFYVQGCVDYATYGTDCTTRGAAVGFDFKPRTTSFRLCVRAVSRTGTLSDESCQTYLVNPAG